MLWRSVGVLTFLEKYLPIRKDVSFHRERDSSDVIHGDAGLAPPASAAQFFLQAFPVFFAVFVTAFVAGEILQCVEMKTSCWHDELSQSAVQNLRAESSVVTPGLRQRD